MAPSVDILIDLQWGEALWSLRDDDFGASGVETFDDPVGIEGLVGDQSAKLDVCDERLDANGVKSVARQQDEANKIAQRICQGEDFGRPAAF